MASKLSHKNKTNSFTTSQKYQGNMLKSKNQSIIKGDANNSKQVDNLNKSVKKEPIKIRLNNDNLDYRFGDMEMEDMPMDLDIEISDVSSKQQNEVSQPSSVLRKSNSQINRQTDSKRISPMYEHRIRRNTDDIKNILSMSSKNPVSRIKRFNNKGQKESKSISTNIYSQKNSSFVGNIDDK